MQGFADATNIARHHAASKCKRRISHTDRPKGITPHNARFTIKALMRDAIELRVSVVFEAARFAPLRLFVFVVMVAPYADAIRARISSTRHAVTRGDSLTGAGYRPDLQPAHHADFLIGMIGGIGGSALGSPMICGKRRNPVSGNEFM
jgi:hypothetical protein